VPAYLFMRLREFLSGAI